MKNAKKCKEPSVSPLRHVLLDISDQASQRFKKRPVAFPCLFCFIVYQMSSNAISDICFFHIISSDCIVIILIIPPTSISRTTLSSWQKVSFRVQPVKISVPPPPLFSPPPLSRLDWFHCCYPWATPRLLIVQSMMMMMMMMMIIVLFFGLFFCYFLSLSSRIKSLTQQSGGGSTA